MARAHEVAIGADGRAFNQAIKSDVIKPVDEAARALDDLADTGDDAGRDAARGVGKLEDALKDAQRETDKLGRETKKTFKNAEDDVRKFGSNARDEFRDSAREGAQSFTGEFDDVQDVLQETVANLGPAGIVGAAIIGSLAAVATQAVEEWEEKIQGIKDATAEMWQQAAEDGRAYVEEDAINAEMSRINWEKAYDADRENAAKAGVSRAEFNRALAEGEGALFEEVTGKIQAEYDKRVAAAEAAASNSRSTTGWTIEALDLEDVAIGRTIDTLKEKNRSTDENRRKAKDYQDAVKLGEQQQRDEFARTTKAAKDRHEALTKPIKQTVELEVDDSKVRNYVPPKKTAYIDFKARQTGFLP